MHHHQSPPSELQEHIPVLHNRWRKILDPVRRMLPQPLKNIFRLFVPRTMTQSFTAVYERDDWQGGSGRGSTPDNTLEYRHVIEEFIRSNHIKKVVDLGCGDWQFSRLIDWGDAEYLGVDTVKSVIESNRRTYGDRHRFEYLDVTQETLPEGDLLLVKDVFQHWPTAAIKAFLPKMKQYRYAILTNCGYPSGILNSDIAMTGYRPLDLRKAPFFLNAEVLLQYRTDESSPGAWNKMVLLYRSDDPLYVEE